MNPEYSNFKDPHKVNNMGDDDIEWMNHNKNNSNDDIKEKFTSLPDEMLFSTWPSVAGRMRDILIISLGFSFASKKWGEILVSNLADVVFDDTAYDRLVLPAEKKKLIKALVDQHQKKRKVFTDIISGKVDILSIDF